MEEVRRHPNEGVFLCLYPNSEERVSQKGIKIPHLPTFYHFSIKF